jgi:endo-1,4-beta-xylanase
MRLTRRDVLASTALLPASALFAASEQTPLKEIARDRGIPFGAAVDWPDAPIPYSPAVSTLYSRECAVLVPSYQFLWSQNQGTPAAFSFTRADNFWDYAGSTKARVVGDKAVWDEFTLVWANDIYSRGGRAKAEELLRTHVSDLVIRFKGRFASWIVVNECLDKFGNGINGLKDAPVYNALGTSSLDIAFHAAHEADPDAELTLNESDLELTFPGNERKRRHMLRLLEGMRKGSVPIHAVGLQSHLRPQYGFDRAGVRRFIARGRESGREDPHHGTRRR